EVITYGYLCVEIDGKYGVSNLNEMIIPLESESPYEYDYFPELFFTKQKGTSKRRYYTKEGNYLGDFVEESIVKAGACFWVKPNKFDKKGRLMDEKGNSVIEEADQLMLLERFDCLAVYKDKNWKIYNTLKKQFLLEHEQITKVNGKPNIEYKPNVFTLETPNGLGLYDADLDIWLIAPHSDIKQIHYLEHGFLTVQKKHGYQVFDFENGLSENSYDYISNPLNYRTEEGMLFLYLGDKMFRMNEDKSIHQVAISEYGSIYLDRYSFRGKDLEYFISFYNRWKDKAGHDPEQFMDFEIIKKMAFEAKENENYTEALRLFGLSAQKNDLDSWVEIGLLLTDPEIEELFDPKKGIAYYEKAAQQNHPVAWNNIGALYQNGTGYSFNIKKAIKAYEKGAELGDGMALTNLGDLYYFGEHVKQDYNKALDFYQKAEKKYYYNYDKISEIYYQLSDYNNLLIYLKKDYEQSYSGIYYGILYEQGLGVNTNLKKAIKYYEQANAYSAYEYATQRLIYYYGESLEFKNDKKFQKWKSFAEQHGFEIDS
ncbi:tetratricopeptide repeat protein, partial [Elizabethkingia meningoseptica]